MEHLVLTNPSPIEKLHEINIELVKSAINSSSKLILGDWEKVFWPLDTF